jgi:hypothetical protein
VGAPAELRGEAGLADAGVAGQEHELPGAGDGLGPALLERVELARAADQRVALERRGERRRPVGDRDGLRARGSGLGGSGRLAAQHAVVDRERGLPRRGAELVAQKDPQLLERPQRLRRVAGGLVDLHQQAVRGLAERRSGDRRPRGLLCGTELAPALAQARLTEGLECAEADRLELAAQLVHPRPIAVGQEGLQVDPEHVARARRGLGPVMRIDRAFGAGGRGRGPLDVHLDRPGGREAQLGPARQRPVAERLAQLGEQRAQRRVGRRGRALGPQEVDQLGPAAITIAVEHEVGEQEPALPSGQGGAHRVVPAINAHRAAEPYDPPHPLTHYGYDATAPPRFLQGFAKRRPA